MNPVAVQLKCLLAQGKPLAVLPLLSQLSVLLSAPAWLIPWLWQLSTLLLLGFRNADLSVLEDNGGCPSLSLVLFKPEQGEQSSWRQRKKVREQQDTSADQPVEPQGAPRTPFESFTGQAPMEPPSSLGDPLASLPCSSLLLQMVLFTASLSRAFCICFFLLSVSSSFLCATSPTGLNWNFLSQSLVIYRSASLLHLSQLRPLPLTQPKRELPPSCIPSVVGAELLSWQLWEVPHGLRSMLPVPQASWDIFGSDFSHPRRFLGCFFLNTIFTLWPFVSFQLKFLCRLLAFRISATPTSFSLWPWKALSHPTYTQLKHCSEHPFLRGGFCSAADAASGPLPLPCYPQEKPLPSAFEADIH